MKPLPAAELVHERARSLSVAVGAVLAAGLWAGCGAPQTSDVCGRHDQCRSSEYCDHGRCVDGDRSSPFNVSNIDASPWFTYADGTCRHDAQCGPWVCHADRCVSPEAAGRTLPAIGDIAYWDGSCAVASDCGSWSCVDSWCTDPEFVSATPMPVVMPLGDGDGRTCGQDLECGGDADCVQPGVCHPGMAHATMTFADIPASGWFDYADGSCTYDTHCGPWVCDLGTCIAPELTGRAIPPRSNFAYYDSSCASNNDCGSWSCVGLWCRDPVYASVYSPNPNGTGMALTGGSYGYGSGYGYGGHGYGSPGPYQVYGSPSYGGSIGGYGYAGPGYGYHGYYGGPGYGTSGILSGAYGQYCSTHTDCQAGYHCIYPGTCVSGDGLTELDPSAMVASGWYAHADGSCSYDDECGPWMCSDEGMCATPYDVGRTMQNRVDYYYDDTSCTGDSHCGDWICSNGWCTEPGHESP